MDSKWDPDIVERREIERLYIRYIHFDCLPAALGQLTWLKELIFNGCTFDDYDTRAFAAGSDSGMLPVTFDCCELDYDALFDFLLTHGSGNWKVSVLDPKQSKRFKLLHKIGNDGAGDWNTRAGCFSLLPEGAKYMSSTLPTKAYSAHLRMLNHGKKPIRELALAYLEKAWPNPTTAHPLVDGTCLLLLGKPAYSSLDELKERIAERGWKVVKGKANPTHAVVFDRPGAKLDQAIAAGLPLLLEKHLRAILDARATAVEPPSEEVSKGLENLLLHKEKANVKLALQNLEPCPLPEQILPALLGTALFHPDKALRSRAKTLLMNDGGLRMRERLQGDNRAYHRLTDGAKLWKLTLDLESEVNVDAQEFSVVLVRLFEIHSPSYVDEALSVALRFEDNGPEVFPYLAKREDLYLPAIKSRFPPGMGALTSLKRIRVQGAHTNTTNMEGLASLPNLRRLEYWVKDANLSLLRPLAHLRELECRGRYSGLTNISELAAWKNLEVLDISETGVTDLAPLAGATELRVLNLEGTPVSDLGPLRGLTSLQHVRLSKSAVQDFSAIEHLTNLEQLDLGFLPVGDLTFTAPLAKLKRINLWGAAVSSLDVLVGKPLTSVELLYTTLPDLTPLARIPTLDSLNMVGTCPPKEQLDCLREALPDLYVRM
jgi:hypothetical protein